MTNIVWTQSALQTLELVYLQTLQYTKNERIAAKLHNKLIKEAEMLRTFPKCGKHSKYFRKSYTLLQSISSRH